MSSGRRPACLLEEVNPGDELNPISHATSTSAVCIPSDASTENQTERYRRMPSNVVYQETTESKQLATKSAWTIGRPTPDVLEYTKAIAQYSLRKVTRCPRARFQLLRPQSRHGIAPHRAPGGDVTGHQRERSQHDHAREQRPRIARARAVDQTCQNGR